MLKKAFTLAEVLITLAIIGVVATLTLPNVVSTYQDKVMLTQLKKNYNMILGVIPTATEKEGATKPSDMLGTQAKNTEFLKKYFDTTKVCTRGDFDKCFASSYKNLKGDSYPIEGVINQSIYAVSQAACAVVSTGAAVCVNASHDGAEFLIDVNGKETPNTIGRDVFWFAVDKEGKSVLAYEIFARGTSTYDANKENKQLSGDDCTQGKVDSNVKYSTCLPKIISNGWKFD